MKSSNPAVYWKDSAWYTSVRDENNKRCHHYIAAGTPEQRDEFKRGFKPRINSEQLAAFEEYLETVASVPQTRQEALRLTGESTPLRVLTALWLRSGVRQDRTDLGDVKAVCNAFTAVYGDLACAAVTEAMATGYIRGLAVSQKTRLNRRNEIRAMFEYGVKLGIVPVNPLPRRSGIKWHTSKQPTTPADAAAIQEHGDPHFALIHNFIYVTGCRPNEACTLSASLLKTDPDGSKFFDLPMHKNAHHGDGRQIDLEVFNKIKTSTLALCERFPNGPIFRRKNGKAWTPNALANQVRKLRLKGLVSKQCIMYGCRHAVATSLDLQNVALKDIARALGNSPQTLVKCYIHEDSFAARAKLRARILAR